MSRHCSKCGSPIYDWQPPHSCTEFFITYEGYDEPNESFWVEDPPYMMKKGRYTPTHEAAAEAWAKWCNECDGEYSLMNDTVDITVTRDGDSRQFRVGAEPSIEYSVELIEVES